MTSALWKPPDHLTVTYSGLGKFTQCRRMWHLAEYRGLRRKDEEARTGPLPFGGRIHTALELWVKGKIEHPVDIWNTLMNAEYVWAESQGFITEKLDKEAKMGHVMLSGLPDWLEQEGFWATYEGISAETALSDHLTVVVVLGGQEVPVKVLIRGKADMILRRKTDDSYWIMDWKALPLDEPVATPTGWTPIGELNAGDLVLGSDYQPTEVLGTYDLGDDDVYRITFNDGTWVRASGDHLWTVERYTGGRLRKTKTITTRELRWQGAGHEDRIAPLTPLAFTEPARLPIDPYVLGVWLGDGGRNISPYKGRVPILVGQAKKDVVLRVAELTGSVVSTISRTGSADQFRVSPDIGIALDHYGLLTMKSPQRWIPMDYLRASYDQRRALLHGLFDTDGSVQTSGSVHYATSSLLLAENVADLVRSLGGWARATKMKRANRYIKGGETIWTGQSSWQVVTKLPFNPFDLHQGKAAKVKPSGHQAKLIRAVVPDGRSAVRCIKVAADDSLFLTRYLTPTHNTTAALAESVLVVLAKSPQTRIYAMLAKLANPELKFYGGLIVFLRKVMQTAAAKPPFYAQMEIPISKSDMIAYRRRLRAAVQDMAGVYVALQNGVDPDDVAYFTPSRPNCMSCQFRQPCDLMASYPAGAVDMLKDMYVHHDPFARYSAMGGKEGDDDAG
jgi:hypothetical protein